MIRRIEAMKHIKLLGAAAVATSWFAYQALAHHAFSAAIEVTYY